MFAHRRALDFLMQMMARRAAVTVASTQARQAAAKYRETALIRRKDGFVLLDDCAERCFPTPASGLTNIKTNQV